MILKELNIVNFRNYDSLSLKLHDNINIIYGDNGQGKSNLLESIYVLGLTKSHRLFIDEHLIKEGSVFSKIKGIVETNGIKKNLEIVLKDKQKEFKVDTDPIKKVGDYITNLSVIIFYPEDLEIIKGSPSIRRKFINTEMSQLQQGYYAVLNDYNRLLKMRNEYLKNPKFDSVYFEILTNHFIDKAYIIYKMRQKFISRINEYAESIYENIMQIKNFKIEYEISEPLSFEKDGKTNIYNYYKKVQEKEILYQKTLFGPHRDDIIFYIGTQDMKSYASQGQQRVAVLAFKLALLELFKKYKEENPILLLDDVFSELDHGKKINLLSYIGDNIQTIITTTELDYLNDDIKKNAKMIKIKQGKKVKQEEVE
ncbi:MAG: DNA replication/repair protein RecF [Bacilli bacterium]|nr:DNA replication/repair protein RecF [Bacilli bacterium]